MANTTSRQRSRPLHLLLLPLSPLQGHLTPTLALAERLLAEGCILTCVLTERSHRSMLDAGAGAASQLTGLRFVTIPEAPAPPESMRRGESKFLTTLRAMKEQQGFVEKLIENSKSSESPISCIIASFMFPWAQDVANKSSIPCVIFWNCSAVVLAVGRVIEAGGGDEELKELQKQLNMNPHTMLEMFPEAEPALTQTILSFFTRLDESSHILINTFSALEGHVLPLLPSNARFIGPCLQLNACATTQLGSMIKEDTSCLKWLDMQDDCSVLFISFGSAGSLSHAQITEMALGVEASNQRFIWVMRQDNTLHANEGSPFPKDFLERTKDRGLVISWAPQLQVLNHRAIGGFLTHCGWNSTLESIFMGVPMLCFPLFGDQPMNEGTVILGGPHERAESSEVHGQATTYGIGIGFEGRRIAGVRSNYVVSREEVKEALGVLLDGDIGLKLRKNVCQLKDHARNALIGSSHTTLRSFVDDIYHSTFS